MFFLFTKHMKLCPFLSNIYIRCLNPFGKKFAFNAISVQLKKILLLQTCTCTIVFFSFLVNDTFLPTYYHPYFTFPPPQTSTQCN
jgi:hypothetical protein